MEKHNYKNVCLLVKKQHIENAYSNLIKSLTASYAGSSRDG